MVNLFWKFPVKFLFVTIFRPQMKIKFNRPLVEWLPWDEEKHRKLYAAGPKMPLLECVPNV